MSIVFLISFLTTSLLSNYYDKRMKKIVLYIIGFFTTLTLATPVFAQSQPICPPGTFTSLCGLNASKVGGLTGVIITFLIVIAILVSIFYLIFGGIRWITSGGDKAKVESARSTLVAAVVGLIISLLAFFIVNFVLGFFTGNGVSTLQIPKLYGN